MANFNDGPDPSAPVEKQIKARKTRGEWFFTSIFVGEPKIENIKKAEMLAARARIQKLREAGWKF